jgi:hypothetical protein
MERVLQNHNTMVLSGQIVTEFQFDHEMYDEKFYRAMIKVVRKSGASDVIPIIVSEKMLDVSYSWLGEYVELRGKYRSYNEHLQDGKNKLRLYLFVEYVNVNMVEDGINTVELSGFVVTKPNYRKTPRGRYIADLILAVNRHNGKADYIPLIFWGRTAGIASWYDVGVNISVSGRVQSREYLKRFDDGTEEIRVAYEVSVQDVQEI